MAKMRDRPPKPMKQLFKSTESQQRVDGSTGTKRTTLKRTQDNDGNTELSAETATFGDYRNRGYQHPRKKARMQVDGKTLTNAISQPTPQSAIPSSLALSNHVFDIVPPPSLSLPKAFIETWKARERMGSKKINRKSKKPKIKPPSFTQGFQTSLLTTEEFSQLFLPASVIADMVDGPVCAYIHCQSTQVRTARQRNIIQGHNVCQACKNYHRDNGGAMRNAELCAMAKRRDAEKSQTSIVCSNKNCEKVMEKGTQQRLIDGERVCDACAKYWKRHAVWRPKALCRSGRLPKRQ